MVIARRSAARESFEQRVEILFTVFGPRAAVPAQRGAAVAGFTALSSRHR